MSSSPDPSRYVRSELANALATSPGEDTAGRWVETPVGPMLALASDRGLALLEFADPERLAAQLDARFPLGWPRVDWEAEDPTLDATEAQLAEYFARARRAFDLPLDLRGTEFQLRVWRELLRVPYGQTVTYLAVAEQLGDPAGTRAVGAANGQNGVAIVVPCHRVIGSDGSLTGYGGGEDRKRWLLDHESGQGTLFPE